MPSYFPNLTKSKRIIRQFPHTVAGSVNSVPVPPPPTSLLVLESLGYLLLETGDRLQLES